MASTSTGEQADHAAAPGRAHADVRSTPGSGVDLEVVVTHSPEGGSWPCAAFLGWLGPEEGATSQPIVAQGFNLACRRGNARAEECRLPTCLQIMRDRRRHVPRGQELDVRDSFEPQQSSANRCALDESPWLWWRLGLFDFDQGLVGPFRSVEGLLELCWRDVGQVAV
jgi:hypothetical protein